MKTIPVKLIPVYNCCDKCILSLIQKGYSKEKAESAVLEILKESANDLKSGNIQLVVSSLKMIFLDSTPQMEAKNVLKSLLAS
jgi:hypothetical protein